MATVITVSKNVIKRAWNDLEPKLITFLATGLTASGLIWAADYVGLKITAPEAAAAVVIISTLAGYIKSSTTTVLPVTPIIPAPVASVAPVVAPVAQDATPAVVTVTATPIA